MVSALIITIMISTSAILGMLWIAYRGILRRLDNMAAQAIIDQRRARRPESPEQRRASPEQRRASFHLIRGGGATAAALGATAWLLDQIRGAGTRTALAAASSSALLLGGADYVSETDFNQPPLTLPVITEDVMTDADHQTEMEAAPADTATAPPPPVESVTPSTDHPNIPEQPIDRPSPPSPDHADDLPPPESDEGDPEAPEDPSPSPSHPPEEDDPEPDDEDHCEVGIRVLALSMCR